MTAVGPYTQATLLFEPEEPQGKAIEVATPGTVLDYIARNHPRFLSLIKKANLLPFYNDTGASQPTMTVFVPREGGDTNTSPLDGAFPVLDGNTAWRICKMSTTPGMITTTMLMSSPILVVYSLGRQPLDIVSNAKKEIWVKNKSLLFGDIVCSNGIVHVIDGLLWPTW